VQWGIDFSEWRRLSPTVRTGLARWFGNGSSLNNRELQHVRRIFSSVDAAFSGGTISFENNPDLSAIAEAKLFGSIHLNHPDWWARPPRRMNGILFHEMTHRYGGLIGDPGYFVEKALSTPASVLPDYQLNGVPVKLTKEQLLSNPDTYEGFFENYYLP